MSRTDNFQKFVKQPKAGAVKEKIRQEKKKEKKERASAIDAHFERKRADRLAQKGIDPTAAKLDKENKKGTNKYKQATAATPTSAPKTNGGPAKQMAIEQMPVNKYIAHSGLCSRRDAIALVKDQKVTLNDQLVTDPGTKVNPGDVVKVAGKKIIPSRNFVYILLNKPKDYITTSDDPQGRRTVLDLVKHATTERVYPVGRLDRNTSGVLLLTNDGELAQKLSHPSNEVKKVYEARLDRAMTKGDFEKMANGLTLEDGFVAPDAIAFADEKDKSIIGIEIHSGRNRIVRRMFEHLKYDVKGLDRVMFAGLTKKNVQRGKWRFLAEKELRILKFMNQSYIKVKD